MLRFSFLLLSLVLVGSGAAYSKSIHVAVATNFKPTFERLSVEYQRLGYPAPVAIYGASGKHTAQILQGLPVDLFLSADTSRPAFLASSLNLPENNIKTYAVGRLSLFSNSKKLIPEANIIELLSSSSTIAIANPKFAPYGQAAEAVLSVVPTEIRKTIKVVQGENVGQAFNLVSAGGAEVGLVAASQVRSIQNGYHRLIPQSYHSKIFQDLLVVRDSLEVRQFTDFIFSPAGEEIIRQYGYDLPR